MLPAEQSRSDIARKRARWQAHQHRVAAGRLVFIDEAWVKTNMAPPARLGAARAAVGGAHALRMLENADPRLRGGRLFIGALRHDRIDAPWVIDGPINGDLFSPEKCANYLRNSGYASV